MNCTYNQGAWMQSFWIVPKGAKNRENAMKLMAFYTRPEPEAQFAQLFPNGVPNTQGLRPHVEGDDGAPADGAREHRAAGPDRPAWWAKKRGRDHQALGRVPGADRRRAGPDASSARRGGGASPRAAAVEGVALTSMATTSIASFHALTPDRVLDAVEVGGLRSTGRCLPLRAFENRVYEVELEDKRRLVVKFYRPGRWSRATILDEHRFLADLVAAEVPAVAPLDLGTGQTLNEARDPTTPPSPRCRPHARRAGRREPPPHRPHHRPHARRRRRRPARHRRKLDLRYYIHEPLEVAEEGRLHPREPGPALPRRRPADRRRRRQAAGRRPVQRIHGDLHWGNILWTPDPLLVDFDDCMMGPPVQDLWLLARGGSEEARQAREDLIEGYELFREFDRSTLVLVEPLRAMRIVYMSGWIARRWDDPSFPQAFPSFTDIRYWMQEYEELIGDRRGARPSRPGARAAPSPGGLGRGGRRGPDEEAAYAAPGGAPRCSLKNASVRLHARSAAALL